MQEAIKVVQPHDSKTHQLKNYVMITFQLFQGSLHNNLQIVLH